MDKILKKLNKLLLPATLIIASIILGGFYFGSQVNKQRSIERQQEVKIEQERQEAEAKAEQDKRDYIAKRKIDCLAIYKTESDKWNNVDGYFYDQERDVCVVRYENPDWKEGDPNSCELFEGLFDDKESTCTIHKYFTKEY